MLANRAMWMPLLWLGNWASSATGFTPMPMSSGRCAWAALAAGFVSIDSRSEKPSPLNGSPDRHSDGLIQQAATDQGLALEAR